MAVPGFQDLMRPVLETARDGERVISEVVDELADKLALTQPDREQMLPSGKQTRFSNRVHWAKSYLIQAGLLKTTGRGLFAITDQGRETLAHGPDAIDMGYLERFPGYQEFKARKRAGNSRSERPLVEFNSSEDDTPDEEIVAAHAEIESQLGADLIFRLREASPAFFEETIVKLLLAMGYGGATGDVGRTLGQSGDRGVDGVIDQDPLGVDQIYIQAKRYGDGNHVGASEIRDFFGALNLQRASKGIFLTTSKFTAEASRTAADLGTRIVLIDYQRLAKLLIRYNIGCKIERVLELKKIDEGFFDPE